MTKYSAIDDGPRRRFYFLTTSNSGIVEWLMIQGEQSVDQRLGVETFCIKLYQIFFGAFNVKLGEEKKFPMCI